MSRSKPKTSFSMTLSGSKRKSLNSNTSKSSANGEKTSKKSALGITQADDNEHAVRRELVTSIGEGRVMTAAPDQKQGPLVIGLAPNRWESPAAAGATQNGSSGAAGNTPRAGTVSSARVPKQVHVSSTIGNKLIKSTGAGPAEEKSIDELAAEAIAQESRGENRVDNGSEGDRYGLGLDSDRVIGMAANAAGGKRAGSPSGGTTLLAQSMIPGLAEVEGEDAKFRHDLGYRAEDLSVRSQVYTAVPVNEFGAALLRGMGWQGPTADDSNNAAGAVQDVVPRHQRLGLGAQPKPPEEMQRARKRRPGEKPKVLEEDARKIWEQKAREEKKQMYQSSEQLSIMDIVEISAGLSSGKMRRAMVLKTQGVPGLNKISVRLEHTGEQVDVDRSSLKKISEDEKARYPFSASKNSRATVGGAKASNGDGERGGSGGEGRGRDRKRSRSRSRSRKRDDEDGKKKSKRSKKEKKREKKRNKQDSSRENYSSASDNDGRSPSRHHSASERNRTNSSGQRRSQEYDRDAAIHRENRNSDRRVDRSRDTPRNGYRDTNGSSTAIGGNHGKDRGTEEKESQWLRANIRVRVVHKSYAGGRAYLGKGRVVDVPRHAEATVRMDNGSLMLEGVKQRHLETVLPARGGKVIVVRGSEKDVTGKLLARDKDKETALVQVYEDLRAITLSLDDVAEFTGMLDDDVDDVGY